MESPLDHQALFEMLNAWAAADPRGVRTGGGVVEGLDHIQLHFRPDARGPEQQLTLQAELRDGRPVIRVSRSPVPATERQRETAVGHAVSEVDVSHDDRARGREPDAICEACGTVGTVGRATRTDDTGTRLEVHRFCLACWPEQSARYRARWQEEDRQHGDAFVRMRDPRSPGLRRGSLFEAATWHTTLDVVREIERMMTTPIPPSAPDLERFVAQIQRVAPEIEGEMPFEVEAFMRRYGPAA